MEFNEIKKNIQYNLAKFAFFYFVEENEFFDIGQQSTEIVLYLGFFWFIS